MKVFHGEATAISAEELRSQLLKMSRRKATDADGLVAECLKDGGEALVTMLASVFTDIRSPTADVLEYWKQMRLNVLFKKGDPQLPENYRPIAVLPILYKLFSKVLCGRIRGILDESQSTDQAGFKSGLSCDDHLFSSTLLSEKMNEFQLPLWISAVDFRKAFHTISHPSLFDSLLEQGVPALYVNCLRRLYAGQKGHIRCECSSKDFPIERRTKQGDPISPILFNVML